MASGPITSCQIDGGKVEIVTDFIFLGSKITIEDDCRHKIKRCLLLGGKAMTNLDIILKSRDISLLTKVHIVKIIILPLIMYGCESWTVKKTEHQRIDPFESWRWKRLLRVPWTERRSNQSILKEISPEYSLQGLMLKLKLQYLGHRKGPGAEAPRAELQPPQDGAKALPLGSCTRLSSSLNNIKPGFQNPSRVPWLLLGRAHFSQHS